MPPGLQKMVPLAITTADRRIIMARVDQIRTSQPDKMVLIQTLNADGISYAPGIVPEPMARMPQDFNDSTIDWIQTYAPMSGLLASLEIDRHQPAEDRTQAKDYGNPSLTSQYAYTKKVLRIFSFSLSPSANQASNGKARVPALYQGAMEPTMEKFIIQRMNGADSEMRKDVIPKSVHPVTLHILKEIEDIYINLPQDDLRTADSRIETMWKPYLSTPQNQWIVPWILTRAIGDILNVPYLFCLLDPITTPHDPVLSRQLISDKQKLRNYLRWFIFHLIDANFLCFIDHDVAKHTYMPSYFESNNVAPKPLGTFMMIKWRCINSTKRPCLANNRMEVEQWPAYGTTVLSNRSNLWQKYSVRNKVGDSAWSGNPI